MPQVISLINAVNIEHSLKTVIPYLRFLFVGIFFLVFISKDKEKIDFIVKSIFFLIIFWTVDASIQFFYKKDIFGSILHIDNPNVTSSCGCGESFNVL